MKPEQIQPYSQWKQDQAEGPDQIIGASRQIAHLSGISLAPKGRWKKQGHVSSLKFSISPKPLKWKGTKGWERLIMVIKNDRGDVSFCIMIDGKPMGTGPNMIWNPIRKANDVIEKATKNLQKNTER